MKKLKITITEIRELSSLVVLIKTDSNIKLIVLKSDIEKNFTYKKKEK